MSTRFTKNGWENVNNSAHGRNNADVVNEEDEIRILSEVVANTLGGDDIISAM